MQTQTRHKKPHHHTTGSLWALMGVCLLLLVALACLAWGFYHHLFAEKADTRRVTLTLPSLVGLPFDKASEVLPADCYDVTTLYLHDPEQPEGTILRQTPTAGTRRKIATGQERIAVKLVISLGPHYETVPNLSGKDGRQAQIDLEAQGFLVKVVRRTTRNRTSGRVIRQDPPAGSRLMAGDTVILYVSYPEAEASVYCPNVVGMDRMSALAALRDAGLTVGDITVQAPQIQPDADPDISQEPISAFWAGDTVVSQSRPADCRLPKGTAVDLVLQQNPLFYNQNIQPHQQKGILYPWRTSPDRPNFTEGSSNAWVDSTPSAWTVSPLTEIPSAAAPSNVGREAGAAGRVF